MELFYVKIGRLSKTAQVLATLWAYDIHPDKDSASLEGMRETLQGETGRAFSLKYLQTVMTTFLSLRLVTREGATKQPGLYSLTNMGRAVWENLGVTIDG